MTLIQPAERAEKETPVAPYDPMAPHYEAFVGDAEVMRYPEWLAGLLALAADHGARGGRALDVGCGTGRSLQALLAAGFDAAGCDPSTGMMEIARGRVGEHVDLQVAALPKIAPGPPVELVTAFNDIINCVAPVDLDEAIAALASRVASGGVLLFDANTPLTFTGFFGKTFCRSSDGLFLVWESLDPGADGGHRADLHAFTADPDDPDRWIRSISHHVQHHHPHERVTAALAAAGLELRVTQGQRDDGPRDPFCDETIHTKRIYVARRP
jgi:SAM-dependent methyltransferase